MAFDPYSPTGGLTGNPTVKKAEDAYKIVSNPIQAGRFLMDQSAKDTPELGTADIDPGTSALLKEQIARSNQSPEEFANGQLQGVGEQGRFIQGLELPSFANMGQANADEALKSRANRHFTEDTIRAKEQAMRQAHGVQSQRLQQAFQQQVAVNNVQRTAFNIARGNMVQKIQARYAVLGAILGGGGALGGEMLGARNQRRAAAPAQNNYGAGSADLSGGMQQTYGGEVA